MNEEQQVEKTDNTPVEVAKLSETPVESNQDVQNELLKTELIKEDDSEQNFDASSLKDKSLGEILAEAETVLTLTPKQAGIKLKAIRSVFFDKFNDLKEKAESTFKSENEDPEVEFVFAENHHLDTLNEIDQKVKQARKEEKERIDLEKKKNLGRKNELLKELEEITLQDETLDSISKVKEIQKEWRTIRVLPKEAVSELWDKYNYLQNKFYDNHSINIELKELDRQKNLGLKIELTKKMDELHSEASLKRSFILLNKYHEEFKNIGPVPAESREPIWQAFKKASDSVYDAKRKVYEELESGKEENLAKKKILSEKADLLNAVKPRDIKGWNEKTKAFEELFAEWKKVGPVPKSNKDAVWIQFNGVRNDFYVARKEYFKELNAGRTENLKAKEALCVKVEELKDSTDWIPVTKQIIGLQEDWKKIGPVPEKVNQAIWKRFRGACDAFFNAKNNAFAGKREEEEENQTKKEAIIASLKELAAKEGDHKAAFTELKRLNAEWRAIGYVPHKAIKKITTAYDEANNAVYTKYSSQIEEAKSANLKDHYKELRNGHNGEQALEREQQNIKRRIGTLNDEIASIERNMSFFASSKTADKMLKDFDQKIVKTKKQISKLKLELGAIRNAKKIDTEAAGDTSDVEKPSE